jgi:hypothetical protein
LLTQVKERLRHGEWRPWLVNNKICISEDTAARYRAVYRGALINPKIRKLRNLTEVYRFLADPGRGSIAPWWTHRTGDPEWYTPTTLVALARKALGGRIDVDPASCDQAQKIVKAGTYFTKNQDGLKRPWHGTVWINPPFHLLAAFEDKLFKELNVGRCRVSVVRVFETASGLN